MSITGNLRTLELAELLQWLAQGQKSGALVVENGELEKRIYFRSGKIISSESNNPEEHLGGFLIRQGLIDEATLSRAVKLQESTQILLGKVLVTLGSISEDDLHRVLHFKTEESIYDLFTWEEGEFHFVPDDLPEKPMVALELDVTNVVLEGMRRLDESRLEAQESAADQQAGDVDETLTVDLYHSSELGDSAAIAEAVAEADELLLDESSDDDSLFVDREPSSAEMRGYYHTEPLRKAARTKLLAAAAAAAILVVVALTYFFFVRPEPAVGVADRATLDPYPTLVKQTPEFDSYERTPPVLVDSVVVTPQETLDLQQVEIPDAPPPASEEPKQSEEIRVRYEAELAALKQQLQQAKLAAAERQAAMQMLKSEEKRSNPQLVELSPPEVLEPSTQLPTAAGLVSEPEVAAGGDEPPSLAGTIPARDTQPASASDLTEELVEPQPEPQTASDGPPPATVQPREPTPSKAEVTLPVLVTRPVPRYPSAALRLGKQADVTVRLLIDENGKVRDVKRVGPLAGMGFDQAALAAARQTAWKPGTRDGVPSKMWAELRISFRP